MGELPDGPEPAPACYPCSPSRATTCNKDGRKRPFPSTPMAILIRITAGQRPIGHECPVSPLRPAKYFKPSIAHKRSRRSEPLSRGLSSHIKCQIRAEPRLLWSTLTGDAHRPADHNDAGLRVVGLFLFAPFPRVLEDNTPDDFKGPRLAPPVVIFIPTAPGQEFGAGCEVSTRTSNNALSAREFDGSQSHHQRPVHGVEGIPRTASPRESG